MKLNEFEVKAAGLEKARLEIEDLALCADMRDGEDCARAMAGMLSWICRRCMEIGWTFEEVAEMAVEDE